MFLGLLEPGNELVSSTMSSVERAMQEFRKANPHKTSVHGKYMKLRKRKPVNEKIIEIKKKYAAFYSSQRDVNYMYMYMYDVF